MPAFPAGGGRCQRAHPRVADEQVFYNDLFPDNEAVDLHFSLASGTLQLINLQDQQLKGTFGFTPSQ